MAIANVIANQAAANIGDKNDLYGGMGRNGAQHTPEAIDAFLLPAGSAYQLQPGSIYNLNADTFIMDHGDVARNEVAHVLLTSIAKT